MIRVNVEVNYKYWNKRIKSTRNYFYPRLKKIQKENNFFTKKDITFTILLTSSVFMKKLNKKFRNINKATDVLSFPFFLKKDLKKTKNKKIYIGDIAVSFQIIKKRSKKGNFYNEFDKVWIHGLLHLIGHDHIKNKDYLKMITVEKKILNSINP
jgi:probable rRNA maturation factor